MNEVVQLVGIVFAWVLHLLLSAFVFCGFIITFTLSQDFAHNLGRAHELLLLVVMGRVAASVREQLVRGIFEHILRQS